MGKVGDDNAGRGRKGNALAEILAAIRDLKAENALLRERVLALERLARPPLATNPPAILPAQESELNADSSGDRKLALFGSLFRGRDDIYALRWEGADGRNGYSPALRPGSLRGKNVKHEADEYLPLRSDVLRRHLTGYREIGYTVIPARQSPRNMAGWPNSTALFESLL